MKHRTKCNECCQKWLDVERITKPYEAAVLLQRGGGGDVAQFLEEDWEDIVKAKGAHRLQHIKGESGSLMLLRPSQLYFFDEISDIKNLAKAKETVILDRMKRDDIKDMLLTLLP